MKLTPAYLKRGFSQLRALGMPLLAERFINRPRVLLTDPCLCPPESPLEVHIQVCRRDWLNAVWTLKSFRHFGGEPFRLVILHDGSLSRAAWKQLDWHFPGAVVADRQRLEPLINQRLRPIAPQLASLWDQKTYFTLPKVVDSWLLALNPTIITLDPDVLFFSHPAELIAGTLPDGAFALLNTLVGRQHRDGLYCIDPDEVDRQFGMNLPYDFATGLGRVSTAKYDFAFLDEVIRAIHPVWELRFMLDQTLMALTAVRSGFSTLPSLRYAIEPVSSLNGVVARHYYSTTRDLMYVEGIRHLRHDGCWQWMDRISGGRISGLGTPPPRDY